MILFTRSLSLTQTPRASAAHVYVLAHQIGKCAADHTPLTCHRDAAASGTALLSAAALGTRRACPVARRATPLSRAKLRRASLRKHPCRSSRSARCWMREMRARVVSERRRRERERERRERERGERRWGEHALGDGCLMGDERASARARPCVGTRGEIHALQEALFLGAERSLVGDEALVVVDERLLLSHKSREREGGREGSRRGERCARARASHVRRTQCK